MKRKTILVTAVLVVLLGGGLYYFWPKGSPGPSDAPAADSQEQTALTFAGNKITQEENGRLLWELTADAIEVDMVTHNATLHNLKGTFYADDGTVMNITSDNGTLDSKTQDVVLTGAVHGVTSTGGDFTSPAANWQGQNHLFVGTGGVRVTKDGTVLTGDRLESDTVLNKIKVTGHAHIVSQGGNFNE